MLPYKTLIELQKKSSTPVFIQIANAFAREIRNGLLKPGCKLPGARTLASHIEVNRNTIASAYEELHVQGYIELYPKKGAFVSKRIPEIKAKPISTTRAIVYPQKAGFTFKTSPSLQPVPEVSKHTLEFNDGLPDERIAPMDELTRTYRAIARRGTRKQFGYTTAAGNPNLRRTLSEFLNETRGLQTTAENILITKGSQMGIFLASQLLLKKGDCVIVGETNYPAADMAFQFAGATLKRVPVDALGINVEAIEAIVKKRAVRAVYVTPHHHYPTTMTLSACRRMNLLGLAEKYGFAILEDDYDYDFHYKSAPILPLASADTKGMVINIGSLSKNFSPALRVAYLVAPKNVIAELTKLRFIIDRQGDYLLEQAMAELFQEGIIRRHLKKALLTYHERRDLFCDLLRAKLKDAVSFEVPSGGLAVWTTFHAKTSLNKVVQNASKKGLLINAGSALAPFQISDNATRLGFASLNAEELKRSVAILSACV